MAEKYEIASASREHFSAINFSANLPSQGSILPVQDQRGERLIEIGNAGPGGHPALVVADRHHAAKPPKPTCPEMSDALLFDTGAALAGRLPSAALAEKAGWAKVEEDAAPGQFKGDAVCLNGRIAVVLRTSAAGAETYTHSAKGWQRRALLAPVKAEKAARLRAVKVLARVRYWPLHQEVVGREVRLTPVTAVSRSPGAFPVCPAIVWRRPGSPARLGRTFSETARPDHTPYPAVLSPV